MGYPESIRLISSKLKALSHLIENQDSDYSAPPMEREVFIGLGAFLDELCQETREISKELEKEEIKNASKINRSRK